MYFPIPIPIPIPIPCMPNSGNTTITQREYAIEPYALFVTVLFPRADAASIPSLVKSWHLALPDLEDFRYIPLVTFDHGKSICHTRTKIEEGPMHGWMHSSVIGLALATQLRSF
jgi:hypothetical protein